MLVLALPDLDDQERYEGGTRRCFHLSLRSERQAAWAVAEPSAKKDGGHPEKCREFCSVSHD